MSTPAVDSPRCSRRKKGVRNFYVVRCYMCDCVQHGENRICLVATDCTFSRACARTHARKTVTRRDLWSMRACEG